RSIPGPTRPAGEKRKWRTHTVRKPFGLWEVRQHLIALAFLIGACPVLPDLTCLWACIDIDVYTGLDYATLALRIFELDVPLYIFRSKSGGYHLFVLFEQPRPVALVRRLLRKWAADLGFPNAEVLPAKQDLELPGAKCGKTIALPFF